MFFFPKPGPNPNYHGYQTLTLNFKKFMLYRQGADLAGEGGGGQDPSPRGREQVGPGGASAGICGRGPREGRGVGRPVCRDVSQNQSQRRQGASYTHTHTHTHHTTLL